MKKLYKLIIACLAIIMVSCDTNTLYELEDGSVTDKLSTDNYQESHRKYKGDGVQYTFCEDIKFFSDLQKFNIESVEDSIIYFNSLVSTKKS